MPERVNRIEGRCFGRRIRSEKDAHEGGEAETESDRPQRNVGRWKAGNSLGANDPETPTAEDTDQAAEK